MKYECNKCNKLFNQKDIIIKSICSKYAGEDVWSTHFLCEKCYNTPEKKHWYS